MDNKKVYEILETSFILETLLFMIEIKSMSGESEEVRQNKTKEWARKAADRVIKNFEGSGLVIVPKEPSFDNLYK